MAVAESATPTKQYVPGKKKVAGWDAQQGSLCHTYFQECERIGCTANSEVVRQLMRRAQILSPLPYHRTQGLTRHQMLEVAFDHLDLDSSGALAVHEILGFCRGVNPAKADREVRDMMEWMDKDGDSNISKEEYMAAMEFLTTILSDQDFEQGVLETLASKPSLADLPNRHDKLLALFNHLDVDGGGVLDVHELMSVANEANPKADAKAAKEQLAWLDTDGDMKVSKAEFVEAMEFMTSYLSEEDFNASLEEEMSVSKFTYKLDTAFIGQKGLTALLPVLKADQGFTSLVLRGCGVHNAGAAALCDALAGHKSLMFLDLGDNPISEGGVEAIVQLCKATPGLKEVLYDGCYFTRGWSNISEDFKPDPNTGGEPLKAAIEYNKNPPPPPPVGDAAVAQLDVAALLRDHRHEVKALFYTLAGADGRVSFEELTAGLLGMSEEWGALSEHLAGFISPAHIFGTSGASDSADADGDSTLSYAEFVGALRSENTRAKVLQACKKKRVELKVLFYTLAGGDGALTLQELGDGMEEALGELMGLVPHYIDVVGRVVLSPAQKDKAVAARHKKKEAEFKETAKAGAVDAARAVQDDKLAKMTPAEKAKWMEKKHKKDAKKSMGKVMMRKG
mmetsp:Transcript_24746/g.60907  ORF Transcript_24746/g.60907 Transcript_24746/m.60907 type:complete len:622 (+) Transcript_24746:2031-3896(+)